MINATPRAWSMPAALFAVTLLASISHAQIVDRTWDGGGSDSLWSNPLNWNPDDVPNTGGGNGERAVIGDSNGNRNILTPTTATTISLIQWTQSLASTGVNQITLQNNLTINHALGNSWTQSNATADPSRMVLDLNGNTLQIPFHFTVHGLTVQDSGTGGVFSVALLQGGSNSIIGPGVTIRTRTGGQVSPGPSTMDYHRDSNIILTAGNSGLSNGAPMGNFQIGELGGTTTVHLGFIGPGTSGTFKGDFTIYSNGSNDANLTFNDTNATIAVMGNFTDHGPATAINYGGGGNNGTIAFYGNPITPSVINIARSLGNNFRVGDLGTEGGGLLASAPSNGNALLGQDLTTTGNLIVRGNSTLDVANHTFTVGSATLINPGVAPPNADFTYTFGADTGLIDVTGALSLNGFTLNVNRGAGWVHGTDVVLMNYGTLSGTPMLTVGDVPHGFDYDEFLTSGGQIMLTNVVLPEPSAAVLLVGSALVLGLRRRRLQNRTI